jgi:wobble nucleotide-excising tRNase
VESINAHLKDSGFEGFRLREKEGVKGTYEVIREDGKVAEKLSEGERNFIAFLYFYHLVRGSQTETDSGKDKIVVIDDPVSSMDSSALFIVSALVREMLGVCSNNVRLEGHEYKGKYIQQIFILTHNAFFHREITYNQVGHYRYVSFFKVNKKNNISTVEKCVIEATKVSEKDRNFNPVQNSYAALWREYEKLDAPIPLMNVIRRILEYYFLQLCGFDSSFLSSTVLSAIKKQIMDEAAGGVPDYTKYHLAQAMLSYINRSDAFNDGLHFVDESIDCDQYRSVFYSIFEVMNQGQHFKHMMEEAE